MSDTCTICDGFGFDENFNECTAGCKPSITPHRGQRVGMVVTNTQHARTGTQYGKAKARPAKPATVKQISYLRSLVEQCDATVPAVIAALAALGADGYGMSMATASKHIDTLRALPKATNVATSTTVRSNRYAGACKYCGQRVAEGAGRIAPRTTGKGWDTMHLDGQCPTAPASAPVCPADGLDLAPLAKYGTKQSTGATTVRFAVPGGDTRLKLRISFAADGVVWVTDAAHYGQRQTYGSQKPGAPYRGKVQDALRAILADPTAAAVRYAEITSTCASCGRPLELAESVAQGMGSVCAGKFGV